MSEPLNTPTVVLLCHEDDRIDREGLTRWLASTMRLAGVVVIGDTPGRRWRALMRERRRSGWIGLADALAFRCWYAARHARPDRAWIDRAIGRLAVQFPNRGDEVPRLFTTDPNGPDTANFLRRLAPDLVIARCKHLLKPAIFQIPSAGTFVLHPGICPEYRNAHGCFWALAGRDLSRVGVTVLRVDAGVDTGAIFLQASCAFDERRDSHVVIQYRAVIDNLASIGAAIVAAAHGRAAPLETAGRRSAVWGQPRLSAYLRWKRAARRADRHASTRFPALS